MKQKNSKFQEKKDNLVKAIDIAIAVFKEYTPVGFTEQNFDFTMVTYELFRNNVINPEPKFDNNNNLTITTEYVFTYFQEATGTTVDKFWEKIEENNLPYKRVNKLKKILGRKKIKNQIEYDFIIDVFVPYQQTGVINEEEITIINDLIEKYENRKR